MEEVVTLEEKKMTFKTNLKFIGLTIFIFSLPLFLIITLLITSYSKTGQINSAKICFECMDHQIKGTGANTANFGQDGDYSRLQNILRK